MSGKSLTQRMVDRFDNGDKTLKFADVDAFGDVSEWISTGSPHLDGDLKTFGLPTGIVEVRGESQSGKTTLSLHLMKQVIQEYGERAVTVILSSERRDNRAYANQIGLDLENIMVHRARTVEDVFNKITQTLKAATEAYDELLMDEIMEENPKLTSRKGEKAMELLAKEKEERGGLRFLFTWDSLGQTVSSMEESKSEENASKDEAGAAGLASAARALSGGLRVFIAKLDQYNATLLIINRPYDKITGHGGKKSYGGKAIELFPTMRLELSRIQGVKVGEEEWGQITQVHTIKTDFDRPKQKFNVEIGYGYGFILDNEDIQIGIEAGILEKFGQHGAKFTFGKKELKWQTRKQLYALYDEKHPLLKVLVKKLTNVVHDKVIKFRDEQLAK